MSCFATDRAVYTAAMSETLVQGITLGIAILGAGLGVLNAWRSWNTDRVRVKVSTSLARSLVADEDAICIDVVNLSSFPVTITSVGFDLASGLNHLAVPKPIFTRGESLPVRLESRTSLTVLQPMATLEDEQLAKVTSAYVRTACGLKVQCSGYLFAEMQLMAATHEAQPEASDR